MADPQDTLPAWPLLVAIIIVVLVVRLLPKLNAWLERRILEQRKKAVREFCEERGFYPSDEDIESVLKRRK